MQIVSAKLHKNELYLQSAHMQIAKLFYKINYILINNSACFAEDLKRPTFSNKSTPHKPRMSLRLKIFINIAVTYSLLPNQLLQLHSDPDAKRFRIRGKSIPYASHQANAQACIRICGILSWMPGTGLSYVSPHPTTYIYIQASDKIFLLQHQTDFCCVSVSAFLSFRFSSSSLLFFSFHQNISDTLSVSTFIFSLLLMISAATVL